MLIKCIKLMRGFQMGSVKETSKDLFMSKLIINYHTLFKEHLFMLTDMIWIHMTRFQFVYVQIVHCFQGLLRSNNNKTSTIFQLALRQPVFLQHQTHFECLLPKSTFFVSSDQRAQFQFKFQFKLHKLMFVVNRQESLFVTTFSK